ncbi:MAG: hypothetical protein NZM44_01005, partial [Candidatus Calescibacterium sp.]|nr:hypothetical protein [Candidatus Calescibacterium sp.]
IRDTAARLDLILKKAALLKSMKHKIYPTHLKPLTETTISTTKIENMKEFVLSTLTNLYTRTEEVVKRIKEKLQLSDNEIEENYFRKYFPVFITSERQNMAVLAAIKDISEVVNKVIEETINPILDEVEKLKKSFEDRELLKLYLRLLGRVKTRQNAFLAMRKLNRNNPEKLQKIEEFINKITNIDDKEIIKTIITQRNIIRKKLMSSFKKVRNVFTNTVFELLGFLYLIGGLSEEEKQKLKEIVGEEIFDLPEDAEPIIKPNQKKELVDKIINISERYANFLESFSSNEILEDIEKIKKSITGESGLRRYYFCSASTGTMLWGEVFVIEKENTKNLYIYVEDISWTRPIKQRMLTFVPISKEINLRIEDIIRNIQLTREVYRKGNITNKKINLRFKRILKEIEFFPYIDKSEEILKPINEAILKEQRYGIYLFYYINEKLDELAGTVKNIWTTLNKQNDKELENKLKEIKENIETVQNIIKWNREQNIKSIYYTFSIGRIIDDILEIPPRKHETTIYLPQLPKVMLILYDQKLNIGTVAEKRYKTIKLDNKEIIENALMNIDIEEYINEWNISIEEKNRFIMAVDNAINTIENKENFMNFIHNLIEKLWNAINENISSERLIPSFKKAKTEEEKKNTEKLKLIRKAYITNKLVIDIIMDMLMGIAGDNI